MAQVLKLGVIQYQPLISECALANLHRRPNCTKPGILAEAITEMFALANISYEHIRLGKWGDLEVGAYSNGSWSGVLGMIINGTLDTVSVEWMSTAYRRKHFDFSYPLYQSQPYFLISSTDATDLMGSASLLFDVFRYDLWLLILITIFVAFSAQKIGRVTNETVKNKFCQRITAVLAGLAVLFITGLYANCLLTQLLHPPTKAPFKDSYQMMEKIEAKKLTLLASFGGHWYIQEMMESDHPYFRKLRKAINYNPILIKPLEIALDMVENGPYLLPVQELYAIDRIQTNCKLAAIGGKDLPLKWSHFMFAKGSPWSKKVENAIKAIQRKITSEIGRFLVQKGKCHRQKKMKEIGGKPLKLVSYGGLVLFCATAFMLSLILLCYEVKSESNKKMKKMKISIYAESDETDEKAAIEGAEIVLQFMRKCNKEELPEWFVKMKIEICEMTI